MSSLRLTAGAAIALSCALSASCALNPATGKPQLSLASQAQEIEIGKEAAQQVEQTIGFVDNRELQSYVSSVGQTLAKGSERPDLPWEFHVVDDPTPNAFALPGGFIYVTRGLVDLLASEAQLASVLGHEVAHVTARHAVNQMSKQQLTQLGLGLGGILFPGVERVSPLVGAGLNLMFLKYSRDDEREADTIGFRYVNQRGYDVSEFDDVFVALQRATTSEGGDLPNWLSTHPGAEERVERARALQASTPSKGGTSGRDVYLRRIDGMVYGQNPRQGFFRGDTFYHPELRFQLQFPAGWRHQNLAQAVIGVEPDGKAVLELTLAPAASADAALRRFASQQAVEVGQSQPESFGGLKGIQAPFMATASNQRIRGVAAFIEQNGRVYQIVGYSAADDYSAASQALGPAIKSFRPLDDPAVLNVMPSRIEIVQVPREQTLAEFAAQYPSSIPIDELAAINQVDGPASHLPMGMLVKRVTGRRDAGLST